MNELNFGAGQSAAVVEYAVAGELWRCGRFDLLAADFEMGAARPEVAPCLAKFHALVCPHARRWLLCRRLYGLQPLLPPADFNPDDFREWSPAELCQALGITRAQLQAELESIRGAWKAMQSGECRVENAEPEKPKAELRTDVTGQAALVFNDDETLAKLGFSDLKLGQEDKAWFSIRVREFDRLLVEKQTSGLARNFLMTELKIRRLDLLLASADQTIGGENWRKNMSVMKELQAQYNDMVRLIDKIAPWASAVTGKYAMAGVLSDVTKAIQTYKRGDTRLVAGFMTAMEIRVECRQ